MKNFVKRKGLNLSNISVGNSRVVWGCNDKSIIFTLRNKKIVKCGILGTLKQVSVGSDGTVLGINKNDRIYHLVNNRWVALVGFLCQISVGSSKQIFGTNKAGRVYYWNGKTWIVTPNTQKFKMVACNSKGFVLALSVYNTPYKWEKRTKKWKKLKGKLQYIEVDIHDNIYGIYREKVFRKGFGCSTYEEITQQFPGSVKSLSVYDKDNVWFISKTGSVYSGILVSAKHLMNLKREKQKVKYFENLRLANISWRIQVNAIPEFGSAKAARLVTKMKRNLEELEKNVPSLLRSDTIVLNWFKQKYQRLYELGVVVETMRLEKEKIRFASERNKFAKEKSEVSLEKDKLLLQKSQVEIEQRSLEYEKVRMLEGKIKIELEKEDLLEQQVKIENEKSIVEDVKLQITGKRESLIQQEKDLKQKVKNFQKQIRESETKETFHEDTILTTKEMIKDFTKNFLDVALSLPKIPTKDIPDLSDEDKSRYLDSGGTSDVFETMYKNERVAVKVLREKYGKSEAQEALILKEVFLSKLLISPSMPYIVRTHGYVILKNGSIGVVMEYLNGGSIKSIIDDEEDIPEKELNRIILQMLEAVNYLHQHNVIHSDIKLDNFLTTRNRKIVKICDFGGSKINDQTETPGEKPYGTDGYQPPEYNQGNAYKIPDKMWDVFSLGTSIYQLVLQKLPFVTVRNNVKLDEATYTNFVSQWKTHFPVLKENLKINEHQKIFEMCCNFIDERSTVSEVLEYAKSNLLR